MGESTVEGGGWLESKGERYADVLVKLITQAQGQPVEYFNQGVGANAISPKSPGYAQSRKPSAMERYRTDVIANDIFQVLATHCSGLSKAINERNQDTKWTRQTRANRYGPNRPAK
jgi:hypothetical protein